MKSFKDYKLSRDILKAVDLLGYKNPTEVQGKVIPKILSGEDVIVKSQTGSGKTAAFAIPISQKVDWEENKPQALVITPTRELAIQVKEDFFNIGRFKRLKVPAIYGKSSYKNQERDLKQKAHVVVGTPGRIIDHLERGTLVTSKIKYLVLDEADEMLNMGFIEQIDEIMKTLPKDVIILLLSATLPKDIQSLSSRYLKNPKVIEIQNKSNSFDRITQEVYESTNKEKFDLLRDITVVENPDNCIIFCNTQQKVNDVRNHLMNLRYTCNKVHGGMEQRDRLRVMNDFKRGKFRYLVATDVAARGIDVDDITHVINFDIPRECESYVHRIGRTGRHDKKGKAITLITGGETRFLREIEEYTGRAITVKDAPKSSDVKASEDAFFGKITRAPKPIKKKGKELEEEIMKIHINAGKKTKMRPVDIVGTLCNIPGITKDDIGIINIVDVSTFVEILNNKGDMVLKALRTKPIKGRIRTVSKDIGMIAASNQKRK